MENEVFWCAADEIKLLMERDEEQAMLRRPEDEERERIKKVRFEEYLAMLAAVVETQAKSSNGEPTHFTDGDNTAGR